MEILFLPLISRGSLKLLGLCARSVPENELCERELGLGPERGGEPRAPAAYSFKELSSLFEMILVQSCNTAPFGAGLDGVGWSCKRTGKGLEQLCQGDKEKPSCSQMRI